MNQFRWKKKVRVSESAPGVQSRGVDRRGKRGKRDRALDKAGMTAAREKKKRGLTRRRKEPARAFP